MSAWCEPFIVSADDGTHDCELDEDATTRPPSCDARSTWIIEIAGYNGRQQTPGVAPVRFVCDKHVVAVMSQYES